MIRPAHLNLIFKLLLAGGLIFGFVMAILPQPPALPGEPSDKMQHIFAFLTLTLLAALAYPRAHWWVIAAWLMVYGALIEVAQAIPALGRDSSFLDWLADAGSIFFVLALAGLFKWAHRFNRQ